MGQRITASGTGIGFRGVLHTNSEKYANFSFELPSIKSQDIIITQINYLQKIEARFYSSFFPGCGTIESFIQRLNEELRTFKQDSVFFRIFSNPNIIKELNKIFQITTKGDIQGITIEINTDEVEIDLSELLTVEGIKIQGGKIKFGADANALKVFFNKVFDRHFKVGKESKKALDKFIKELQQSNNEDVLSKITPDLKDIISSIKIEGSITKKAKIERKLSTTNFMNYSAKDIKAAENGDEDIKKKLEEAKNNIKDFIFSKAYQYNASDNMITALRMTWETNFERKLSQMAFWEKSGTISAIAGAFGEFQAALLHNYIKVVLQHSRLPQAIISETINQNEQPKVDVTFLKDIGVQVKNYNPFTTGSKSDLFKSDIHPTKLVQYPDFNVNQTDFFDFLTNYFFNSTYQAQNTGTFSALENRLGDYFAEILSFDLSAEVTDTVTFYYINGQYLVPGSELLAMAYSSITGGLDRSKVSITSAHNPIGSDKDFEFINKAGIHHQPFSKWWEITGYNKYDKVPTFMPTGENLKEYNYLINSGISIRTGFHYKSIEGLSRFSLF